MGLLTLLWSRRCFSAGTRPTNGQPCPARRAPAGQDSRRRQTGRLGSLRRHRRLRQLPHPATTTRRGWRPCMTRRTSTSPWSGATRRRCTTWWDSSFDIGSGWKSDCLQLRLKTDMVIGCVDCWYSHGCQASCSEYPVRVASPTAATRRPMSLPSRRSTMRSRWERKRPS